MKWAKCYLQKHQVSFSSLTKISVAQDWNCCWILPLVKKEILLKTNNQQQSWGGEEGLPKKWEEQQKVVAEEWNQVDPKRVAPGKKSIASPTNPPKLLQASTQKLLTAAWHGPSFVFIHPNPQPLQDPKKATWQEMKVTGGSHPCSLYLCRFQLSSSADTNIHCSPRTMPPQAAHGYQDRAQAPQHKSKPRAPLCQAQTFHGYFRCF